MEHKIHFINGESIIDNSSLALVNKFSVHKIRIAKRMVTLLILINAFLEEI